MSIIPGDSHPVPDDAYPVSGMAALQQLTSEEDVKGLVKMQALTPLGQFRTDWINNILGGIGKALQDGINGAKQAASAWFDSIFAAGKTVKDQQLELNDRTDLLLPFIDRGVLYMDSVEGWYNGGFMPFNRQIGPMQHVTFTASGIRLDDIGQWKVRAKLTASWVRLATAEVTWRILATRPDGSFFAEARHTMTNANNRTMHEDLEIVIDEPGVLVRVEVLTIGVGRGILGGPGWNFLKAEHMNRTIGIGENGSGMLTNNPTNPDGDIAGEG